MHTANRDRVISGILVLAMLLASQLACNALSQATAPENPSEPEQGNQDEVPGDGSGEDSDSDSSEGIVEPAFGEETLPCPVKGTSLYLGFDHAFTINYQETSIHHFLHQGWLWLEVSDDAGTIVSKDSPSLTYTMEGVMSDECTLESEGTMKPSAHGTCENGVVSLFITENYQPLKGEMVCIDDDGDVYRMPFESPPSVQTHEGENGIGEIFYLVEGSEGYSSMRPFLEGDGYHTWTLYTDDMPVVPLAP